MLQVIVSVEAHQIPGQDALQKLATARKNTVDLTAGPGSVQEPADFHINLLEYGQVTKHSREKHQVVVMDPDDVASLQLLDKALGKQLVDLLVGGPDGFIKSRLTRMIVKQRPQNLVYKSAAISYGLLCELQSLTREAVVVFVRKLVGDPDWVRRMFLSQTVREGLNLILGDFEASPPIPCELLCL